MARITGVKNKIRQMNQASFQVMCDALLAKKGYHHGVALGTMAGSEKTTPGTPDTYVSSAEGKYIFVEYTTQQEGLAKKIRSDIEKCLDERKTGISHDLISKIIYFHNSSNISVKDDHELKEYCRHFGIPLTIWGIDSLAEELLQHFPSIIHDHLQLSFDTWQVIGIDDFVAYHDNNAKAAPLGTTFLFREDEMRSVAEKLTKVDVVVIIAPAGTGKTRFALEFARKHAKENHEEIVCIRNLSLEIYEDLRIAFEDPGKYFIIIDDANQLSNLSMIIGFLNALSSDHSYKILVTVRDYAVQKVASILESTVQFSSIKLQALSGNEIMQLVKQHFGIVNQEYLDRIVEISDGNPRLAMLAGKTALDANRLDSIKDASDLYDAYYGTALHESTISKDSIRLFCAGVVSFLGVLHLDHIDPLREMLEAKGITDDSFRDAIHQLHSAEMVDVYYDTAVRISDQCFADYVLKYVFCDKRIIPLDEMILICLKPYHGHTIRAISTLYGKYQNAEIHSFLDETIKKAWKQLESDHSDMFWDFLMSFFPVNPLETLVILKERIHDTNRVLLDICQIDTSEGKNNASISDDYIQVLGGYSETTYIDEALDLFFSYYLKRPDLYMQFYHASCQYYGINKRAHEIGYYTQIRYVQKATQYSENWNNEYMAILFLEVMQEFLKLHFEPIESGKNNNIIIYQIPLCSSEAAIEYRKLIWLQLTAIAHTGKHNDRLKALLRSYGGNFEECSIDVIKSDAPHIIQIANLILSSSDLIDCLLVKDISERLMRAEVDISNLSVFLTSAKMDKYRILVGPSRRDNISYEEMRKNHKKAIVTYFSNSDSKTDAFFSLYCIYLELESQDYRASLGITYALEELASDKDGFISVVKEIMLRKDSVGINLGCVVRILFQLVDIAEVKSIIDRYSGIHQDAWMYFYFLEMPSEQIDRTHVQELYTFLHEEQSNSQSNISSIRDFRFLDKYTTIDSSVLVKATEIIFGKRFVQPQLIFRYFGNMFMGNDNVSALLSAFGENIQLLCDLYLFLYVSGYNHDDGTYLRELLKANPIMTDNVADAIVQRKKKHILDDADSRYSVLFYTEQFIDTISCLVDQIVEYAKCSRLYAPDILSVFFLVPQNKPDILALQQKWVTSYIRKNAQNIERMTYIFGAVANHSFGLMKDCVAAFIVCNRDFDAFKALAITPTSYSGYGSFVPHYSRCIEVLESLLPLFVGIETVQHKLAVEREIDCYERKIREEEIENIIRG